MEKRAHLRMKFSRPTEHTSDPLAASQAQEPDNEVIDMSTTGACIITATQHTPGKRIMFELNINDTDEKIMKEATVQWIKPDKQKFRVGIKFI